MCTTTYDLPAEVRELYYDDQPSPRPMVTFSDARARYAPAPATPPTLPVFELTDHRDPRTLGDLFGAGLNIARDLEADLGVECRIAFLRDEHGRINGVVFGARAAR